MSNSATTPFQQQWADHASRFSLDVTIPFRVVVDRHEIEIPVLLKQFGGRRGMLLVTRYGLIRDYADRLVTMGYGYSCLSEPGSTSQTDDVGFVEMLQDWGWSGDAPEPGWLTRHAG
ncbi:MAG: hypothetical protein ACTHLZ_10900 [Tepidisphaeraceae bacterium]